MPKIPDCDRCKLFSHTKYLVCAVHPAGPEGKYCRDFETAELWELEDPKNYKDYNFKDLMWHPLFTGRCPDCRHPFSRFKLPPVNWYCEECGWEDELA
jgi:hypothetical protein